MTVSRQDELSITSTASLPSSSTKTTSNTYMLQTQSGIKIPLTQETSPHHHTNYLIVGRQASSADIRIDHKSISRKHAVLYYDDDTNHDNNSGNKNGALILYDLGSKYGCYVNNKRLDNMSKVVLLPGDSIIFGNVREQMFTVTLIPNTQNLSSSDKENNIVDQSETSTITLNNDSSNHAQNELMLSGRAKREAEIAAMMESLDETPTYTKFTSDPVEHDISNQTTNTSSNTHIHSNSTSSSLQHYDDDEDSKQISIIKQYKIPVSSSITLSSTSTVSSSSNHSQTNPTITNISIDPSGSRFIVSSTNYSLRFYDFGGMDLTAKPFLIQSELQDGQFATHTCFSNTGDKIIIGLTSAQPVLLDRDGNIIIEFIKGDPYVMDMTHTLGHVASITSIQFHPIQKDVVITSSLDGSVRLWDIQRNKTQFNKLCSCSATTTSTTSSKTNNAIYRIKDRVGKKASVSCVTFSPSGREFALGTTCGSIQIYKLGKVSTRPDHVVYDCHLRYGSNYTSPMQKATAIHSLVYSPDGTKLASRTLEEDCVKVWDVRRLCSSSQPIMICIGLPSYYEYSNSAFSPDGSLLCAGTSVQLKLGKKDQNNSSTFDSSSSKEYGMLKFYRIEKQNTLSTNTTVLPPLLEINIQVGISAIYTTWHPKLNQIFVGLSNGTIRIFYDPTYSLKGALLCVAKGLPKEDELSLLLQSRAPTGSAGISSSEIITPHALPMFRQNQTMDRNTTKRKRDKDRMDPIASKKPQPPGTGIKVGEGTSAGLNFQQHMLSKNMIKNRNIAGKDPREDLFKYAANDDSKKFLTGYDTEKPILAEKTIEEEEEEMGK